MTFLLNPDTFAKLKQQLADSNQVVMAETSAAGAGASAGTITHEAIQATYNYSPNTLTVDVVTGGNFLVNHVIKEKIQDAIDAATVKA